jgi:hypothetical protein
VAVKKLKKLSSLTNNYRFYEGDKLFKDNHTIKKGIHYIQFRSHLKDSINKGVHINIVENKSLIIVQLKTRLYLHQIMKIEKLKKISEGYFFYSNNRKLSLSSKLDKGNHFLHFYSKILGGAKVNWWELLLKIKPQIENNWRNRHTNIYKEDDGPILKRIQ